MDKLERVARAICEADGYDPDGPVMDIYIQDDPDAGRPWAGYRKHAQAAIAALESSTPKRCIKCGAPENNHPFRHPFVAQ